jgi:D-alanyl-D-alanine carboxypeptidase
LHERLDALGLDADEYGKRIDLPLVAEPRWLAHAGFDRYRRPLWLHPRAARAWAGLRAAALRDGIVIDAISGYRSHDYQLGIFERKRARGLTVDAILTVNAAPGFSEHHSGRALDISAPGEPPAEESFELTAAFAWLREHAGGHGFEMSYPRDNPHGIVYEPWHWRYCVHGAGQRIEETRA